MKQCVFCGTGITGGNGKTKYCSIKCRKKEAERLFRERGRIHQSRKIYICKRCGIEFRKKSAGDNKGFYCSRECSFKDWHNRCATHLAKVRADSIIVGGYKIGKASKVWFGKCSVCADWYSARQAYALVCKNPLCKKIRQAATSGISKKYGEEYMCPDCGRVFTVEYGQGPRTRWCCVCVKRRGQRTARSKREARIRGAITLESVDPIYILRRDKWICYLCGTTMNPNLYGEPTPKGKPLDLTRPTIDHVVPLSRGGAHSKDNLKACCMGCNVDKGDMHTECKDMFIGRYTKRLIEARAGGGLVLQENQ